MYTLIKKYTYDPLTRNSIAIMLNSAFSALFGLLFWIVAARTLSSKDIGLATATISVATLIIGLSRLGMDSGIVRYLPNSNDKSGLYYTINVLVSALAIFITIIFMKGITVFTPDLIFLRHGSFLLIFTIYILITSIYSVQNTTFIAIRRADISFVQNLIFGLRIPILFVFANQGVLGIFSDLLIVTVIALIYGIFILSRYGFSFISNFDFISVRKIFQFSLGNYIANIISMAPMSFIPLMIVHTIGAEENAYFYVAYSIAGLLMIIPNAASMSLFVEGSHNFPLRENVIKSIKLILLLLFPAFLFTFLFGDKLLLLFSKEYSAQSIEILRLLAISSIFQSMISIYLTIKKVEKDIKIVNYLSFIQSIILIGIGYYLLLNYGLIGLGYAWLGTNIVVCIIITIRVINNENWGIIPFNEINNS